MESDICPLCDKNIDESQPSTALTDKGILSLQKANEESQDEKISFSQGQGQKVHNSCRAKYIHKREIRKHLESKLEKANPINPTTSLRRSSTPTFDFSTDCFLCGGTLLDTSGQILRKVDSINFKDSILEHSLNRSDT